MPLVGVRPESQLLLGGRPKSCKSMRFDDQEPADQRACDNKDQQRNSLDRDRNSERVRHLIEQDRQHQDERRAEERTEDRTKPADDHHEENLERAVDREGERLPRTEIDEGPERTGHTDDEGRDRKRHQLGIERADADEFGSDVHVADRHPLAAEIAAHEVLGDHGEGDDEH